MATLPPPPRPVNPLAPYHTVNDFFAGAPAMRQDFERFFAEPMKASAEHQVWNYWYVPQSYTYLRTLPEKVIERSRVEQFVQRLTTYAWQRYGLASVSWPNLSLYVEGCGQTVHNDSRNGAFGNVFSLTPWERRRFSGGETQILREQDYWASGRYREAGSGVSFYDLVESHFNQLLVFDDRLLHGVPTLRGVADPLEGRLVLHGHLKSNGISAGGALDPVFQRDGIGSLGDLLAEAQGEIAREAGRFHGFATLAVNVVPDGAVHGVQTLVQRVLADNGLQRDVPALEGLRPRLSKLRFPRTQGPSRVVVPVIFN